MKMRCSGWDGQYFSAVSVCLGPFFFIFLFFIEIHEGFLPCFVFLGAHQVIYKELPAGFG